MLLQVLGRQPAIGWIWLVSVSLAVVGYVVSARRPWLFLLVLPVSAFVAWSFIADMVNPALSPGILRDAGQPYVVQTYLAAGLVIVVPVAGLLRGIARRRSPRVVP